VDADGGRNCATQACLGLCGVVNDACGERDCGACGASSGSVASGGSGSNGNNSNGGLSSGGSNGNNSNGGLSSGGSNGNVSSGGTESSGGMASGGVSSGGMASGGLSSGGSCAPTTCLAAGKDCGRISNGCGGFLECGNCEGFDICGGITPNVCGCDPQTCLGLGATCGTFDDSCGGTLECGACNGTDVCNPVSLECCTPTSCAAEGKNCGPISDNCGGVLLCGGCVGPQTCGGGNTPNVCGCTMRDPATACGTRTCGSVSDGCGGIIQCGTCSGASVCERFTQTCMTSAEVCALQDAACGTVTDACNRGVDCAPCPPGQVCNARNLSCGACQPRTCAEAGAACGNIPDGCGNMIPCGTCTGGLVCDAITRECGPCAPTTCMDQGKDCGTISDGCGGTRNCGACSNGELCGGDGVANVCGRYVDPSCRAAGRDCGTLTNACGDDVTCGTCAPGEACNNNVCSCVPDTCAGLGLGGCRPQSTQPDRCGGMLTCGCSATQACFNGACCSPRTCTDLPGQCGTLSDGCGGNVTCGCSGSECINGSCCATPRTCAVDYPGQCGNFDNGCGGMLPCSCGAGTQCVTGQCRSPRTCADYPGQCGVLSNDVGGWLNCGCSGTTVCVDDADADTNAGVCRDCAGALPMGAECGLINDNIPNQNSITFVEQRQCNCAAGNACRGTGANPATGVCTTCAEATQACGTLPDNIVAPYVDPTVTCTNTCNGATPDCVNNACCNIRTCAADYPGQCGGSLSNGCGGNLNCATNCGPGQGCNTTTNMCAAVLTCADYPGQCGNMLPNGLGQFIDCRGACTTPGQGCNTTTNMCTAVLTCANYPGQCGLMANGLGGFIACGCGAGLVCRGSGGTDNDGVCEGCTALLTAGGAECGIIQDNIPASAGGTNYANETRTCTCAANAHPNETCRGPVGGNAGFGLCTTCGEAGALCGTITDNIASYTENATCMSSCMGVTPDCSTTNMCCDLRTCAADYPGQCGASLSNGCGGNLNCRTACPMGQGCNATTNLCANVLTCANYPGQCGAALSDGIGGFIDCRSACTGGQMCNTSTNMCAAVFTCANYPGQCGVLSNNIGGFIRCGCSAGSSICKDDGDADTNAGVCQTCAQLLTAEGTGPDGAAGCGIFADNITPPAGSGQSFDEELQCRCGAAGTVCRGPFRRADMSTINTVGICRTCGALGASCGNISENIPGNYTSETAACTNTCGGATPDCNTGTQTCCNNLTCAMELDGQCGTFNNGCGGNTTCACDPDSTCISGMCCLKRTCAFYAGAESCGVLSDGCGGNITCGCDTAASGQVCRSGTCRSCTELNVACGTITDDNPNLTESRVCPNTCMNPQVCTGTSCCTPMGCNNRHGMVSDGCGQTLVCTCSMDQVALGNGTCCLPMDPCIGQPAGAMRTDNCGRVIICQGG